MTFRCVVFAAVSSRPQVEKESISSQIENAQALIQRRGWQEVVASLIVPGESRDIDFLHEAMEEVPAIANLIELARTHTIDLVIVRDYDRLARTRTLLTQISAYLNRCQVQIYALNKPVEPISIAELANIGQASMTSATVEAFAGLTAQQEIERLRERRRFGMNGLARKGLWKHRTPPYGYTREIPTEDGGVIYLDVPQIVPEQVAIIKRIEELYLSGQSMRGIAVMLNLDKTPPPIGSAWSAASVTNIMHNPFYCGWIVWGLRRNQKVYDPKTMRFVTRGVPVPAYATMLASQVRRPTLDDFLAHRDILVADGVVIEKGQHEPICTEERRRQIDREIEARLLGTGRGASTSAALPRLFTGLMKCAECGSTMYPRANKNGRIYYCCSRYREGACKTGVTVREDDILKDVEVVIHNFITPGAIDQYLDARAEQDLTGIQDAIHSTSQALKTLSGRRARWDTAYEGEVIDLQTYGQKLSELEMEHERLQKTLMNLQKQVAFQQNHKERREQLLHSAETFPALTTKNRATVKQRLRTLIQCIIIDSGKIVEIKFFQ